MVACFFNKPRILTTLIRAGADLVPRNNEGWWKENICFLNYQISF
jgi:hypothetical protein